MKLQSITLTNFRQFRGEQHFNLDTDEAKPVSLLFGGNGAGKTTLLNAFTWVLYGIFSEDVEHRERLVTDSVWRGTSLGGHAEVSVEIAFEHEGSRYTALRRASIRKEGNHQKAVPSELKLWTTKKDGSSDIIGAPQERIYSILPLNISRFFLFNGERIEKLVEKSAYDEVQQDIKVLLNLEQVERALTDLPKVDRKLAVDIRKFGGDKASAIQSAIDDLQEQEVDHRTERRVLEKDLEILAGELEEIEALLRKHSAVAHIQQQRDSVNNNLTEDRKAYTAALEDRANLIASRGFLAFTEELSESSRILAETLYKKGALPAPLKREFVDKLLDDGNCICGSPLDNESEPWNRVNEWRQRAGLQAVETAWQKLRGQMEPMVQARKDLHKDLGRITKEIAALKEKIDRLEERKTELDGELRTSRLEDVQDLEAKRVDLEKRQGRHHMRMGVIDSELNKIARGVDQKLKERKNAEVGDELAAKARARSEMVQNVRQALEEILKIRSERMRQRLDMELKSVYKSISYKNYVPALSRSFELTLHTDVDGISLPVAKSTGENQILSLSFVAAISKLAREVRGRGLEGDSDEGAGIYPIVMDAAFGSLDENYQEAVARALAMMAPQLVVLVSKSQGLGKVVSELNPYVSNLGVIEAHSSHPSATEEDIELHGQLYPYIRRADSDYALLKEIL